MNDQEREVIADIFRRLEQVADQPRDPEAERFIQERLRQQSYAPYAMAQTIFVQEQALKNLQAEVEALRAEREEGRQPQGGGLLSSIFGGARPPAPPARPGPAPGRTPWGGQTGTPYGTQPPVGAGGPWGQAVAGPRGGGGFLQGALSTAAGVAGGMMLANALTSAFTGAGSAVQTADAGDKGAGAEQADAQSNDPNAGTTDSLYHDANQEEPDDFSDFGGDGGDGGDWV